MTHHLHGVESTWLEPRHRDAVGRLSDRRFGRQLIHGKSDAVRYLPRARLIGRPADGDA